MIRPRVIETNEGIQNELTVEIFQEFAENMRDKGWNNVDTMIASGITGKDILEIGPGPGFVGLELAKKIKADSLTGLEISPAMIKTAKRNAESYHIPASYVQGNAAKMPFADASFDSVISNGSLHEWEQPVSVFNEIHRVLQSKGRYCITDMRRDCHPLKSKMIYLSTRPKQMRPGFLSSLRASYTITEITELLRNSKLKNAKVKKDFFGLCIYGQKD